MRTCFCNAMRFTTQYLKLSNKCIEISPEKIKCKHSMSFFKQETLSETPDLEFCMRDVNVIYKILSHTRTEAVEK